MDLEIPRTFFGWCTVLDAALLALSALLLLLAQDWVCKIHGLWFRLPREVLTGKIYSVLGTWKILAIVFHFVPWLALVLMT